MSHHSHKSIPKLNGHKKKKIKQSKPIVKGDVVILSHKRIGVVRYVGDIPEYSDQNITWYGIEIRMTSGKLGDSDGRIGKTTYFKCGVNEGIFVHLNDILRVIEPKELLEKVVKLTKIKNSMHELLHESNHELRNLKNTMNLNSMPKSNHNYSNRRKRTPKHAKKRTKHMSKLPSLYDENSGSATYEPSVSESDAISLSNDYSVTAFSQNPENSIYSKYSSFRKANHIYDISDDGDEDGINADSPRVQLKVAASLKARDRKSISFDDVHRAKYDEINKWDTQQITQWIKSFAVIDNIWLNFMDKIQQHNIHGSDILNMDESKLLSQQLAIDPSHINHIRDTLIYQLQHKKTSVVQAPSLPNSSSTLAHEEEVQVKNKMVLKHTVSELEFDEDQRSFDELYLYFNKMDHKKWGKVDYDTFQALLIEINPELEPYKLSNSAIRRCFKEFDLTKNGYITIEEFIVVMGKTYLRGLYKKNRKQKLTRNDIKTFFVQIIKHFLKKGQKNINYKQKSKKKPMLRHKSLSRSHTRSESKPPPPPPPRRGSTSRSRPPPPKKQISPSTSCNEY